MTQKIVIDWRAAPKGNELKPEIILMDADGEPVRHASGNPMTYPMSVDAILSCEEGQEIKAGDVLARIPREGAKTRDARRHRARRGDAGDARARELGDDFKSFDSCARARGARARGVARVRLGRRRDVREGFERRARARAGGGVENDGIGARGGGARERERDSTSARRHGSGARETGERVFVDGVVDESRRREASGGTAGAERDREALAEFGGGERGGVRDGDVARGAGV